MARLKYQSQEDDVGTIAMILAYINLNASLHIALYGFNLPSVSIFLRI